MAQEQSSHKPERYIGLDIHKKYLVAAGVDAEQNQVMPFRKVTWGQFDAWMEKHLKPGDAVVLEMTTNTWEVYDRLVEHVHSVTVVHPPHVALITRAQVMNDKRASLILATLHAAGLLPGIWVPPQEVRDMRALVAQRHKMVRLATRAKNRLHAILHRHHLALPEGSQPFHPKHEDFWLELPVSEVERTIVQVNWETIVFAQRQAELLEECINKAAAQDDRVPLLVQLPGVGTLVAMTVLAAIGDISRFPSEKKLVGYAGLGARVHDSGQTHRSGRITKRGRKDLRWAMVTAAHHAVRSHPYWKAYYEWIEPRLGRPKAIVAIARKLLVAVWHVLTEECADRFADPTKVACSLFKHAYRVGVRNLPDDMSALAFTRYHLDRLGLGRDLTHLPWGSRNFRLPPSELAG